MSDLRFELKTKIQIYGKHYMISTVELSDYALSLPYETVVFPCDADGCIISWGGACLDVYGTEDKAIQGHKHIANEVSNYRINLQSKINGY